MFFKTFIDEYASQKLTILTLKFLQFDEYVKVQDIIDSRRMAALRKKV